MINILVCINDGLLKIRINRLLTSQGYHFMSTDKPIKRTDLSNYDAVIVHSTYRLPNLISFIENAVIYKLSTVIYVTSNPLSNPFRKFHDHPNLISVDEVKMDVELPFALNMLDKYSDQLKKLNQENVKLSQNLNEVNMMAKCKRKLMKTGYTEEEAHKYILQYAMDNHLNKYDACKCLLEINSD